MSNIHNITRDMHWLHQVIDHRLMFFVCKTYTSVAHYFNEVLHLKDPTCLYQKVKFSLIKTDHEVLIMGSQDYINTPVSKIYDAEGTVKKGRSDYPNVVSADADFELLEFRKEWVLVEGVTYGFDQQKEVYSSIGLDRYWLPLRHTNIPHEYFLDFTWEDLQTYGKGWSESQKDLIKQNLELKDRVAFLHELFDTENIKMLSPPRLDEVNSVYTQFVKNHNLVFEDRLLLILTLINHIQPDFLLRLKVFINDYPDLGGATGQTFQGFLPTIDTFVFLLGGRDMAKRYEALRFLQRESVLLQEEWVVCADALPGEPVFSGVVGLHPDKVLELLDLEKNYVTP
jgi:hypothetical protein